MLAYTLVPNPPLYHARSGESECTPRDDNYTDVFPGFVYLSSGDSDNEENVSHSALLISKHTSGQPGGKLALPTPIQSQAHIKMLSKRGSLMT